MATCMSGLVRISRKIPNCRGISISSVCYGKKNFRKFPLFNKRGTRLFKKMQAENPREDIPIYNYGVKKTGYDVDGKFVHIPEMVPELVVPDLTDFKLRPYVSYRVPEVVQSEFTSKDLFDAVYSKKVVEDFESGKLDDEANPVKPSEEEALTPEEAKKRARMTGADIFCENDWKRELKDK